MRRPAAPCVETETLPACSAALSIRSAITVSLSAYATNDSLIASLAAEIGDLIYNDSNCRTVCIAVLRLMAGLRGGQWHVGGWGQ